MRGNSTAARSLLQSPVQAFLGRFRAARRWARMSGISSCRRARWRASSSTSWGSRSVLRPARRQGPLTTCPAQTAGRRSATCINSTPPRCISFWRNGPVATVRSAREAQDGLQKRSLFSRRPIRHRSSRFCERDPRLFAGSQLKDGRRPPVRDIGIRGCSTPRARNGVRSVSSR